VTGGIVGGLAEAPRPAPPRPGRAGGVGGNIKQPTKVKDVKPVYPAIAQSARPGRRHHRGDDRTERRGAGSEVSARSPSTPRRSTPCASAIPPTLLNGVPVP
jgi:hypothetical protein